MSFVRKFTACLISIALVLAQLSATARGTSIDVAGNGSVLSLGINGSKGSASKKWTSPSGIVTQGSLEVIVENATRLKGAVIASQTNDLQLSTRTLSTQDIALYDNDRQVSGSIGINTTINGPNGPKSAKPGFKINATYANKQIKGIARATISGGQIEVTSQTSKQTAQQLASLNRNADKSLEITSVIDEGFELYGSDTSVKAIGKFLDKYLDTRKLTPKEKKNVREALDALADGGKMVCVERQGYNHWNPLNWLVTPAYAAEECTIYTASGPIQLGIKTYDECKEAIEAYISDLPRDEQLALAYDAGLYGPAATQHELEMIDLFSNGILKWGAADKGLWKAFKAGRNIAIDQEEQQFDEIVSIQNSTTLSDEEKEEQLILMGIQPALAITIIATSLTKAGRASVSRILRTARRALLRKGSYRVVKPSGIPDNWISKPAKGNGKIYHNPNNRNDFVRVMEGNPNSSFPAQQKPYVINSKNGKIVDINGKPVSSKVPAAHIPLTDFKFIR